MIKTFRSPGPELLFARKSAALFYPIDVAQGLERVVRRKLPHLTRPKPVVMWRCYRKTLAGRSAGRVTWVRKSGQALAELKPLSKLDRVGFESIEIEPTRIYSSNQIRQFLSGDAEADGIAQIAEGKLMSAFVRARKPA